ncbi:uncharacterized protein [Halyomorpha halys]|uniref:uncharacterized protein n=1 Tax=Halyomorpha halys TaxID=286706 RepID=UPI0006D4F924|nr:uncharacterized protein LOC106688356 [Halyomorpha halys]
MTDLMDQLYSAHQILIPPNLPSILKKYAKAAIRTQPRDLLLWSYYYFKAVSNGLPPPVKERIEYPLPETASGLTPGFLKVIYNQIGNVKTVPKEVIEEKWENICLEKEKVEMLFKVGSFAQEVNWLKFLAIAAGSIEKNLTGTMSLLCELLTEEPEGGSSMIPIETFFSLYKYLASLNCGPDDPYPVSLETSSEESSEIIETDIQYSRHGIEGSEDTWDTLIREMGQQDSEDTLATDDLREVDSKAGLVVWPDLIPEELKLKPQESSPQPSAEFVTSDTGLQVWDEEQFQNKTVERIEINEAVEDVQQDVSGGNTSEDEGLHARPHSEAQPPATTEMGLDKELNEFEGEGVEHMGDAEFYGQTPSESSLKDQSKPTKDEQNDDTEEKKDIHLEFIMEPDTSMILVPTPIVSRESLCSDQRSIKNITDSEEEPSTGQKLITTASLKDLKVGSRKIKKEEPPPPWAAGDVFWVYLPGIGPPIPQYIVDEVEVYLRQCASKQCGMVMPRNLRHFLCPSLDGLGEEVYLECKEPECLECSLQSVNEDVTQVIQLSESATDHYFF